MKVGLGRCTLPINMECWCKSDCWWVEVNLAVPSHVGVLPDNKHWSLSLVMVAVELGTWYSLVSKCSRK